jgi:hypothetical protein
MTGRVWRFPFDDEVSTLAVIARPPLEVVNLSLWGGDIHPPLSYLLFQFLGWLGGGAPAMRLCSLGMTARSDR